MKSEISRTQEPLNNQGKIEVHDFNITARIPTAQWTTSWFMHELFGHHPEAIIMSPTGGVVTEEYFKPVRELERDTGSGGAFSGGKDDENRAKHTDEDTERFWLLKNKPFMEELKQSGWTVFPKVEKASDWTLDHLNIKSDKMYWRQFPLSDLIRAIQITHNKYEQDFDRAISDLQEVQALEDKAHHIYSTGAFSSDELLYLPVKFRDNHLNLTLDELKILNPEPRDQVFPMRRTVHLQFELEPSARNDLPEDAIRRIRTLAKDYLKAAVKEPHQCRVSYDGKKMHIKLQDRSYYPETEHHPNTTVLLEQALEVGQTVEKIIETEKAYCKREHESLLARRREELDINLAEDVTPK